MNTVLVHIGNEVPEYAFDCIKSFRFFNPDEILVMIVSDNLVGKTNIQLEKKQLKCIIEPSSKYESDLSRKFDKTFSHSSGFWHVTTKRLFILDQYAYLHKKPIIHFENDVVIYFSLKKFRDTFNSFEKTLLTDGSVDKIMLGFSVLTPEFLCGFCQFVLNESNNPIALKKHKYDWLSDMTLLKIFSKEFPECIEFLPTLPNSLHLDKFDGTLFDPASWGQFLGGTNNGHQPGFIDPSHIIGNAIQKNKHWSIVFDKEKGPLLQSGEKIYHINNLHIHSKRLKDFAILD